MNTIHRLIGQILCSIGIHRTEFRRHYHGAFRPHFICKRWGCGYFKG